MIEIRDCNSDEMWYTLYCVECEKRFGTPVEIMQNYANRSKEARNMRSERIKRFERIHDNCCGKS